MELEMTDNLKDEKPVSANEIAVEDAVGQLFGKLYAFAQESPIGACGAIG
jgi:hypothetical protein